MERKEQIKAPEQKKDALIGTMKDLEQPENHYMKKLLIMISKSRLMIKSY